MCGIAGYCDFTKRVDHATLVNMTNALHHRGPDGSGFMTWDEDKAAIGFGHRRLSVIDLSSNASQPMQSACKNYAIAFNGEIYNYKTIKKELEESGTSFFSDSDTEVVLNAHIKWGAEAVDKFIGMFAYAIYDLEKQEISVFRDRAGVKPLYYYWDDKHFLFASELKSFHQCSAFKKEIDRKSVQTYLQYGYVLAPHTIFKNAFKVKPGNYLKIDIQRKTLEEIEYWNVSTFYNKPKLSISLAEAKEATERLLQSAYEYRMVADVPVGIFLSGGYDSSSVAALLQTNRTQKLKTFSIGFHEREFNEANHAKAVATHLGTDHIEYYCTPEDAKAIIPKLPEIFDEPFGDSSAIPTVLVSQLARKHVTVSLSADGGDEQFAGYEKYQKLIRYYNEVHKIPSSLRHLSALPLSVAESLVGDSGLLSYESTNKLRKLIGVLKSEKDVVNFLKIMNEILTPIEIKKLLVDERALQSNSYSDFLDSNSNDELNTVLALDYKTYMVDDILTKVDRATMSVSLEGREPLLDHRIIEFYAQLPSNYKIHNGISKYILKEIVHKHIPKKIMERPKMGFGVPIKYWLKDELKTLLETYFDPKKIAEQGLFNPAEMAKLRDNYLNGSKNVNVQKLWILLMFQMWYERWMN